MIFKLPSSLQHSVVPWFGEEVQSVYKKDCRHPCVFACTCGQRILWGYRSHRKANGQGQENGFRSLCAIHAVFLTPIPLPRGQLEKDNLHTARMPSKCFCRRAWLLRQIWLKWGREGGDFAASGTAAQGGERQENVNCCECERHGLFLHQICVCVSVYARKRSVVYF